jgi:hypothetical protein
MLNLKKQIKKLRIWSFFLFLVPMIGILGTLFAHNFLINYKNIAEFPFEFSSKSPILCNKSNNYCEIYINFILDPRSKNYKLNEKSQKKSISNCTKYKYLKEIHFNNTQISFSDFNSKFLTKNNSGINSLKDTSKNIEFNLVLKKTNILNLDCIKNRSYYSFHKKFPILFNTIDKLKYDERYVSATSNAVYPFFFGETSISNIVKRYPINYMFKPIMFFASIIMFFYWKANNSLFNYILNQKVKNKFYIYGIMSAIFLFFHVLFLGLDFNNSIFKLLRKIIIILFILFEVMAQYSLIRKMYDYKNKFLSFINLIVFKIKILLVSFIIISTVIIVFILAFYDLTKTFDYFLEWNYFIILLFFYLLSSLMWKKIN